MELSQFKQTFGQLLVGQMAGFASWCFQEMLLCYSLLGAGGGALHM